MARRLARLGLDVVALVALLIFGVVIIRSLRAQSSSRGSQSQDTSVEALPSFEVASIKPNHSGQGGNNSNFFPLVSPHVGATNVTANWLIESAYQLKDFQIFGAPAWADSHRYDLEADIEKPTFEQMQALPRAEQAHQIDVMLQSLLAQRFALKITHETRQLPVLVLTLADDSKLKKLSAQPPEQNPDGGFTFRWGRNGQIDIRASRVTVPVLAKALSLALHQMVVDETNVKGNYDLTILWTDEAQLQPGGASEPAYDRSLSAALEAKGLKLHSRRGPVDTITITHIEEPTPN